MGSSQGPYLATHNNHRTQTFIFLTVFEPTFPAEERPHVRVLDGAALGSTAYGMDMLIMAFSNTKSSITEDKPLSCIQKRKGRKTWSRKKVLLFQAVTPPVSAHLFQRSCHWSCDSSSSLAVRWAWNESSDRIEHLHVTEMLSPQQHTTLTKLVMKISAYLYRNDKALILLITHQTISVVVGSASCKWVLNKMRPVHRY
jgi:hypothetical protein